MDNLLLHPKVSFALSTMTKQPPQSLLVSGRVGSGKYSISIGLIASLLEIDELKVSTHPYVKMIDHNEKTISIDEIREIKEFLKLKVPSTKKTNRAVFIDRAERMGVEAQNAILKTLEEPPKSTVILLTASQPDLLLETIRSRTQILEVLPVSKSQARRYFSESSDQDISKYYALSQGQAGLLCSLMSQSEHKLIANVELAKTILSEKPGRRVMRTDDLAKDKLSLNELFDALLRLTHAGLTVSAQKSSSQSVEAWRAKQQSILTAIEQLSKNANTKLVLDNLFMSI